MTSGRNSSFFLHHYPKFPHHGDLQKTRDLCKGAKKVIQQPQQVNWGGSGGVDWYMAPSWDCRNSQSLH